MNIFIIFCSVFLFTIIYFRFGFKLKYQRAWLIIFFIVVIFALISYYYNFSIQWEKLVIELQLGSLATIFSALAAILVVAQLSINSPLIFTTIFQNLRNKELVLVVKANAENNLTFYIHNVSKSTAIDVVVRVEFPQQIRVLSIDTPVM